MIRLCALLWAWSDVPGDAQDRLDPSRKAIILLAFAGILLVGILVILMTWLSGRAVRRYLHHSNHLLSRDSHNSSLDDAGAKTPLVPQSDEDPDAEPDSFLEP